VTEPGAGEFFRTRFIKNGVFSQTLDSGIGVETLLQELAQDMRRTIYGAHPVRRVRIPRPDDTLRPLGIPTVRDWVVHMAVTLIIELIGEADFCAHSYG